MNLVSFRRQNLLIEYASLKHIQLRGVYVSLTPSDPSQWTGVLFIRRGIYNPAIFRFRLSFPPAYPYVPPIVTFSSDIFHPLITPLTTYTHVGTDGGNSNTAGDEVLPPGAISLRSGFPVWYDRTSTAKGEDDQDASRQGKEDICVAEVLRYVRQAFEDEAILDAVPFEAAVNPGAWYAWQAFRGRKPTETSAMPDAKATADRDTTKLGARGPREWKWDGVWEERVKRAVQNSLSEGALFGSASAMDDEIHFEKVDEEALENMRDALAAEAGAGVGSP